MVPRHEAAVGVTTAPTEVEAVKVAPSSVLNRSSGLPAAPVRAAATQRPALEQAALSTIEVAVGSVALCQVAPPSTVRSITGAPLEVAPTPTQWVRDEQSRCEMAWVLVGKVPSVCQLAPASLVANALTGDCPPVTRQSRESLHATAPMPLPPGRGLVGTQARWWPKVAPMAQGAPLAWPAAMHEAPAQPTEVNAVLAGAEDRTTDHVPPTSVLAVRTAPAGLGSNEAPAATHSDGAPQPTAARLPPRKGLG